MRTAKADQPPVQIDCPECHKPGIIRSERDDTDRTKPDSWNYYVSHPQGLRRCLVKPEHRDVALKAIGRYIAKKVPRLKVPQQPKQPRSKRPPEELQHVIRAIGQNYMTLEDNIKLALELGRKHGFKDLEIGDMIRAELKKVGRSRMTLSRYLPATAKHMERARPKSDFGNKMLPNKPVTISTESETLPSTNTITIATKLQQQQRPGWFNKVPDEYEIDKLDQYDTEYLRSIVKWNHETREGYIKESFKWQPKFDEMEAENKALKEETTRLEEKVAELEAENEYLIKRLKQEKPL